MEAEQSVTEQRSEMSYVSEETGDEKGDRVLQARRARIDLAIHTSPWRRRAKGAVCEKVMTCRCGCAWEEPVTRGRRSSCTDVSSCRERVRGVRVVATRVLCT